MPGRSLRHLMLVAIAACGAAIVFRQLAGGAPLWLDEEMIAINIRDRSIGQLASPLWLGQSAPLGWLALQRLMVVSAGTSEIVLRAIPALFGVALMVTAVAVGRRWLHFTGAVTLSLLCAFALWLSYYALELKHYSADAFWALLLPALAVWAAEAGDVRTLRRRAGLWWALSAVGHWTSNGALFASPACAVVLFAAAWRRFGRREALAVAAMGLAWLVSFGIYYQVSLAHTHRSSFLRYHWADRLAPAGAGIFDLAAWFAARLPELARQPIGTAWPVTFWTCAAAGFAVARRRVLGTTFALVVLTAFPLAFLVPLYDRFALWAVPSLFMGLALLADRAASLLQSGWRSRRWLELTAAAALVPVALLTFDIVRAGIAEIGLARDAGSNHGLHDRRAAEWVMRTWRPGDAVITTRLGWPALWWYGSFDTESMTSRRAPRLSRHDLFTINRVLGRDCAADGIRASLHGHARVVIYMGFPDHPYGFEEIVLRELDRVGALWSYERFGDGFAAVFDLHTPGAAEDTLSLVPREVPPALPEGCAELVPVERF